MGLSSLRVGETLVLTIDRPPVNALDLAAVEALREAFSAIGRDPPRDGVVLTGTGDRAFSAGVDTQAFAGLDKAGRRAMCSRSCPRPRSRRPNLRHNKLFVTVKRQVRGPLAARVLALAASGDDPLLEDFF